MPSSIALFYSSLFILTHIAPPKKPRNNPETDAPHPIKFNMNVDGSMRMMVNKGMTQPTRSRIKPRARRKRGEVIGHSYNQQATK
jgi:hypothetical protein